jgi:hypothetical protein
MKTSLENQKVRKMFNLSMTTSVLVGTLGSIQHYNGSFPRAKVAKT